MLTSHLFNHVPFITQGPSGQPIENITSCQIEIENLRTMVTPQETVQPADTDHDMEGALYIAKVSWVQCVVKRVY